MVSFTGLITALAATGTLTSVLAHPEDHTQVKRHEIDRQVLARNHWANVGKRSSDKCQSNLKHRELMARSANRRAETVQKLRQKRGINSKAKKYRRDLATLQEFEAQNHNMTGELNYSPNTSSETIFAANTSCITSPENTDGPYYVWGELVRQNVKENVSSTGVDMYLEVQWIDVETCEPIPNVMVDIWNCNATGTYSGVESGQGGLDSTFLRGIQSTDEDGISSFETIFPGHYDGRATHTHLLAHINATLLPNNTLLKDTGSVPHIGQIFYQEDLREAVEVTYPYNTNTVEVTTNDEDMWAPVQAGNGTQSFDPFPEYVYLGDSIEDGLFAWVQIGINSSATQVNATSNYYAVAAYYTEEGGYANADSNFGGGGAPGNGTGNGTTGTPPDA